MKSLIRKLFIFYFKNELVQVKKYINARMETGDVIRTQEAGGALDTLQIMKLLV